MKVISKWSLYMQRGQPRTLGFVERDIFCLPGFCGFFWGHVMETWIRQWGEKDRKWRCGMTDVDIPGGRGEGIQSKAKKKGKTPHLWDWKKDERMCWGREKWELWAHTPSDNLWFSYKGVMGVARQAQREWGLSRKACIWNMSVKRISENQKMNKTLGSDIWLWVRFTGLSWNPSPLARRL